MYWVSECETRSECGVLLGVRRYREVRWGPHWSQLPGSNLGMIPGADLNIQDGHRLPGLWRFHLYGEGAHRHVHFILDFENGTLVAEHLARAEGGQQWKWQPFGGMWRPDLGRLIYKCVSKVELVNGVARMNVGLAPVRRWHLGIAFDDWRFNIVIAKDGQVLAVKRQTPKDPVDRAGLDIIIGSCFDTTDTPETEKRMQVEVEKPARTHEAMKAFADDLHLKPDDHSVAPI